MFVVSVLSFLCQALHGLSFAYILKSQPRSSYYISAFAKLSVSMHRNMSSAKYSCLALARKVSGGWMILYCLIVALESATLCQGGSSEGSHQDCSQDDRSTLLYQKLEGALINNSKALFQLKKTFFSVSGSHTQEVEILQLHVCVRVSATIKFRSHGVCANSSNGTHICCWDFQWSASALSSFITVDELMAIDFLYVNWIYSRIRGSIRDHNLNITLNNEPDLLPCIHENDLKEVLIQLLSWAKAYARAQGRPRTWKERDRGYLTIQYNYWTSVHEGSGFRKNHDIHIILIGLYISLNIFILLVFVVAGNYCQKKITDLSSKQPSHTYMTAVIGITFFNILYVLSVVFALIFNYPRVWATMKGSWSSNNPPIPTGTRVYKDEEITLILKYITLPVTVIIELFLAMKIYYSSFLLPPSLAVKLCCSCYHCCSERQKDKAFQILIWWNVMVFIQLLVGHVALPVFILLIIAPAVTISMMGVAILLYIYVPIATICLILIIRYHCSQTKCGLACAELLGLAAFLALLTSLVYFYFELLQTGSSLTSIEGFIIALLPSAVLSVTAWLIKRMCIKGDRNDDKEIEKGEVRPEEQSLLYNKL